MRTSPTCATAKGRSRCRAAPKTRRALSRCSSARRCSRTWRLTRLRRAAATANRPSRSRPTSRSRRPEKPEKKRRRSPPKASRRRRTHPSRTPRRRLRRRRPKTRRRRTSPTKPRRRRRSREPAEPHDEPFAHHLEALVEARKGAGTPESRYSGVADRTRAGVRAVCRAHDADFAAARVGAAAAREKYAVRQSQARHHGESRARARRAQGARAAAPHRGYAVGRSEEHTSELQSRVDISYAVFCLKK